MELIVTSLGIAVRGLPLSLVKRIHIFVFTLSLIDLQECLQLRLLITLCQLTNIIVTVLLIVNVFLFLF